MAEAVPARYHHVMTDHVTFQSILERKFRWPQVGDRPFTRSTARSDNAYIDPYGHGRLAMMIAGYKKAGDLMVESAARDRFDRDALVFPIVFNYRQFIELSLKALIAWYGYTISIEANWKTHDLMTLWKTFEQVLDGYGISNEDGTDEVVASIVAEFGKVDPSSFSYRYPVDTKGHRIPMTHEELDLRQLADVMQAFDGYVSGCDGYLNALQGAGP